MNTQRTLQQTLVQVNQLDSQICLKLPAGRVSIQQQIKQIAVAEQHLKAVKNQVLRLSAKNHQPSQQHYSSLINQIEKALQNAMNFKHLAEEFFIDPEGATSLLQTINQQEAYHLPENTLYR